MARAKRIVVKCFPDELESIRIQALSLDKEPATFLREIGLAYTGSDNFEEIAHHQLYWLAGSLMQLLESWQAQYSAECPPLLSDSMRVTIAALRQLQLEALLDKLPCSQLNSHFTGAIAEAHYANQRH